jgi:hypothetical protein
VLRAAGETETTQENIRNWLELDEGDPEFQLLTEEEIAAVIYFYSFLSALLILLNFPFICFLSFSLSFEAIFCFIHSDYGLIRTTSHPKLIRIIQDWLQIEEGGPGFQLLTEEEIAAVIFFVYFHQHYLHN